jgi:hypothetical protein
VVFQATFVPELGTRDSPFSGAGKSTTQVPGFPERPATVRTDYMKHVGTAIASSTSAA